MGNVVKRKGILFSKRNVTKFPGLKIVLPIGVSEEAMKKARTIGKRNLAKQNKVIKPKKPVNTQIPALERKLAEFVRGREFVLERTPYRQSKLVITSPDGKRLTMHIVSGRGTKEEVKNINAFTNYVSLMAANAKLK